MPLSQRRTRLLARLRARKTRVREGMVLVEGVRAVTAALDAGVEARFAVTSLRLASTEAGAELARRLEGIDVDEVDDRELAEAADTRAPQGVLLVCAEPHASIGALDGNRFLVLDGIQDPGNLGTLVRGAVAFGLDGVVCLDGSVDPWGTKSVRSAAGLLFGTVVVEARAGEALERFAALGVPLFVADASGTDVEAHRGAERFALVVGNEGAGVRPAVAAAADATVMVPMAGSAESLNAGVAGSILMHTLTSERNE